MGKHQPIGGVSKGENGLTVPVWTYGELGRRLHRGYSIVGGSRWKHRVKDASLAMSIVDIEGFKVHRAPRPPWDGSR